MHSKHKWPTNGINIYGCGFKIDVQNRAILAKGKSIDTPSDNEGWDFIIENCGRRKGVTKKNRKITNQVDDIITNTIKKALNKNGWLIQVKNISDGIALANRLAPEHCELMLKAPNFAVKQITTAGAIFVGTWTPTVLGDYMAGPSHTLPTGGAGASFPGLTVDMFQRRTSVVEYTKQSLARSIETVSTFAGLEGLDAHGRSAEIRLEK